MPKLIHRTAKGMLVSNTPIQNYLNEYGFWVKREDMSCPPPGPQFSKSRGVYAHLLNVNQTLIGVLDTYHSQAGHAVATACKILGKQCVNYYPEFKHEPGPRPPQLRAKKLGATLHGLKAGRSAILFHTARRLITEQGGYMMPNALKLKESVTETAKECTGSWDLIIVPASSATIAAGVILGHGPRTKYLIHLGYKRSHKEVLSYVQDTSGVTGAYITLIDEGYEYKDTAADGPTPPWPCNPYYDLKAFRWWTKTGRSVYNGGRTLFWNIG